MAGEAEKTGAWDDGTLIGAWLDVSDLRDVGCLDLTNERR